MRAQAQAEAKPKTGLSKRILLAGIVILITFAIILSALRVFITTQSGARFIENQVNSRSFGQIESVEISGLSGDPLGAFTIGSITIKDKDGLWAQASKLSIDWNGFALLWRHVDIETIDVQTVNIPRKPILNSGVETPDTTSDTTSDTTPRSTSGTSQNLSLPKISLASFTAPQIKLGETLIGRDISLTANGKFISETSGQITSFLNVSSADIRRGISPDKILLDMTRDPSGQLNGLFEISGPPDGAMAALLKSPPAQSIAGSGQLKGTAQTGDAKLDLSFGDQKAVNITSNWTANTLSLGGNAQLTAWPILQPISQRFGMSAAITSRIERGPKGEFTGQDFTAGLTSDIVSAKLSGTLPQDGGLPQTLQTHIDISQTSRLAKLPEGYDIGKSSVNGSLSLQPNLAFNGTAKVQNIKAPFGIIDGLNGPVVISQGADKRINANLDISANAIKLTDYDGILAPIARLNVNASYYPDTQSVTLPKLDFTSGAQILSVNGRLMTDLSVIDISGKTNITIAPDIKLAASIPAGDLASDFSLHKTRNSGIGLSADGRYRMSKIADGQFPDLIGPDLIGPELLYSIAMNPIDGGVNVDRFRIESSGLVAEVSGALSERFELSGEAQTRSVINAASLVIAPQTRASFQLSGPRNAPSIRVEANSGGINVSGREFKSVNLRADLSNLIANPNGPVQIDAQTQYGDLSAKADLAVGDIKSAKNIELALGGLMASGDITMDTNNLLNGAVVLNLAKDGTRSVTGHLNLKPEGQEQGLTFALDANDVAYDKTAFDILKINAGGTLSNLTAIIEAKGTYDPSGTPQSFSLKTDTQTRRGDDNVITLSATPMASWNEIIISARAPITAESQSGRIKLQAPLSLDDHNVDINYSLENGQESLAAKAVNIPTNLLPLPGPLAESRGNFTADINISHDGTKPSGTSTLSLSDWRGFDAAKGEGLTAGFEIKLGEGEQSSWALSGNSVQGFGLNGNGGFSLKPSASLAQTRPNLDAPIKGKVTARGPAVNILGLFTPNADEIKGTLNLALDISGSAAKPLLLGQVQGQTLAFEIPEIGTQIKQGRFTAAFTNDTIKLADVSVNDGEDGSLTAQGDFKLGEFGRPIGRGDVKLTKFTALDRRDVKAVLGGNLSFESTPDASKLSGDLLIDKVNIREFISGAASVIDIETEHINLPPALKAAPIKPAGHPLNLDVKINAPRNILINSNGIDLEMSIDASVKGTAKAPEFFGTANVVRGGYKLAGQLLEFETGKIEFNGPLETAALSLTAQTETQNLTATVVISGTVETPKITLSSSPERPQDEVLSALLFGRSATELSPLETVQLASALAQFSGVGVGFDLIGGLRETLGVSQLNISTADDGSTQLSGGRYIAKNVYLQLFSGNSLDQTSAVIDWTIRPNIALQSKILADNDQSLSLKWKKDF